MNTICVTGGNGLLGSKVLQAAESKYRVVSIDLEPEPLAEYGHVVYIQGDVTHAQGIHERIVGVKPDCVIHTAAFTDVDGCERERTKARSVNVDGARNVALACKKLGIKMIHLSTDYVFDGQAGPYSEEDEPSPVGYYGETKLESEDVIRQILDDYVIARTMVLYGYAPGVRLNFVTWLVDRLGQGNRVSIVDDQFGTPTLADDLARSLLILYQKDGRGLYHTAGSECLSRYAFALSVADVFGLDASLISRITTADLNQTARRPLRSGLKIDKIRREMGVDFSSASQGLRIVKQQMDGSESTIAEKG